ncbi:MAG TPA: hypothetical protein VGM06_25825 [Polyangiaceae bacterium]|jgi:hypothetical protein
MVPPAHRAFVNHALEVFEADARFVGVAAAGSWIAGTMDVHSDVDLVAVARASALDEVMADRRAVLDRLGPVLAAFTGEHVGEPRLMIALYGPPLLHVDVKFVGVDDLARRVEDPVVLWERDGVVSRAIASSASHWPQPDWQRTEDRFWVWVHYAATKLARGELYEALDCLAFLRGTVLVPLAATARGRNARGVRFLERDLPDVAVALRATIAGYDEKEIRAAVTATIAFYRGLREESAPPTLVQREAAERAAVAFLGGA